MAFFLNFSSSSLSQESVDVVVCGSGIAGLTCAIKLKELGLNTLILTRGIGNTYYSQGGIACADDPRDSPYMHFLDTLRAGKGLCDERAVMVLVEEGIQRLVDLKLWGVKFDEEKTLEGGHSFPRVSKVKDYTGRAIYEALYRKTQQLSIPIVLGTLEEFLLDEKVEGVLYSTQDGLRIIRSKAVVVATGGAAGMFLHTSNPLRIRGDGMGLCLRFGCIIRDPEFVQFHPTVVKDTNILVSEAVRGEGAILVDERGERFVDELQTRDVVARAIYRKLMEGGKVYLDLRHLVSKGIDIRERFPTIYSMLRERGYDPQTQPIPVLPSAHYFIGGLRTDTWGRTTLGGLYAVGECASTGVHGANRLASNSLLEGVVFGYRCAYRVYEDIRYTKPSLRAFKNLKDATLKPSFSVDDLRRLMWEKVGLERTQEGLKEAQEKLLGWLDGYQRWERTPENRALLDISLVALACVRGAIMRKESRGAHYRRDYPHEREEFRFNTHLTLGELL